ncbi:citrate synthase-like protein [Lipomyces orientalis]|uniref:Citrate synthase-like protein n=1 Tax=Lipomyces orientalis TaxID=1233043 RepID=A0ACC3TKI8_9ASCO
MAIASASSVTSSVVKPRNTITVVDNRTGKSIEIEITNNSIPATAFSQLKAPYADGERTENDTPYGLRILDPSFINTAMIQSEITYIDGNKGFLMHRGYPIEQLAEKSSYLETAYLLIYGELPSKSQSDLWTWEIMHHTFVADDLQQMIRQMRYDSHPMSVFISAFAAMSAFAPEANPSLQGNDIYINNKGLMNKQIVRILGKATTVAAMAYRIRINRPFTPPRSDLSYTENLLYMMDHMAEPNSYRPDPRLAKALDILFILHADHEMNCSTAAMVHVGSSLVDPYSCVAAASAALYGPLHGGANEAVIRMLTKIGSVENVPVFLDAVKQKKELLFGFGHRVYRETDPRSKVIREVADMVFEVCGREPLIEVAIALKDAALKDEYFTSRKLFPNVDYWSGLIYKAMGFPLDFFPVLFVVPRVSGYLAHWKQQLESGKNKISRPRQVYVGKSRRDYIPVEARVERTITGQNGLTEIPHYISKRRLTKI